MTGLFVGEEAGAHRDRDDKSYCKRSVEGQEEDGSRDLLATRLEEEEADNIDHVLREDIAEALAAAYSDVDGSRSIFGQDKT